MQRMHLFAAILAKKTRFIKTGADAGEGRLLGGKNDATTSEPSKPPFVEFDIQLNYE
ncbi:MAG: hypothetical protein ACI33P_07825 [Lysinibacillus sp.]